MSLRRFRDWTTFDRYKRGVWPLYGRDGRLYYICPDGDREVCVSEHSQLYAGLVDMTERYCASLCGGAAGDPGSPSGSAPDSVQMLPLRILGEKGRRLTMVKGQKVMTTQKKVRHLVLGDIHGMYRQMMRSLTAAHFVEEQDTSIFLGDLVDGPESREVLDFVSTLRSRILILGNHEYALRTIASGMSAMVEEWLDTYRGRATCWSYGVDPALITVTKHRTPQIRFDNEVVSGRELLQRIFPPEHLALLDEMIPSLIMKDLCPGHDALLCHAGLTAGATLRDHEDWMFAYGDPEWYERAADRTDPPVTVIYGHWHHKAHPAFSRRRIGLALESDVAVMSVEERAIWIGDDIVYPIEREWTC